MELYRQCGIFSFYCSICLLVSSSYSDFCCSLIFFLRCFGALHIINIHYPLLIYDASVYRGSVWINGVFPYFNLNQCYFLFQQQKCVIYSKFSPFQKPPHTHLVILYSHWTPCRVHQYACGWGHGYKRNEEVRFIFKKKLTINK